MKQNLDRKSEREAKPGAETGQCVRKREQSVFARMYVCAKQIERTSTK